MPLTEGGARGHNTPLYVIGNAGRMAVEISDGLPPTGELNADIVLDACETESLVVRAATCRGLLHRRRNTPRQDAYATGWHVPSRTLIVAVADGVGSRPRSHEASSRAVARVVDRWLVQPVPLAALVREANEDLRSYANETERQGQMSTTLTVMTCSSDGDVDIAWVGDSAVWSLHNGVWSELTRQDSDDNSFEEPIRALPTSDLQIAEKHLRTEAADLFVMSDGVGKALELSSEVRSTLGTWWQTPPDPFLFGAQVNFARESYMDDRTVVGLWRSTAKDQSTNSTLASAAPSTI